MKRITFFVISLIALSSILWVSCGKEEVSTPQEEIQKAADEPMSYTTYYDQTTKVLEFPAYGTSITINHN